MVVIPAGGPFSRPVAISKFEIRLADYGTYCELSGACSPKSGESRLPLTGVSVQEVEAFTQWLNEQTGARYRLPTASEWEYAARADGDVGSNFNCRVGGTRNGLVRVDTGVSNGWGLTNHLGNAREWVRGESGWEVRGGAYTDDYSQCEDPSFGAEHSGQADQLTGFRLVREVG